LIYSFPLHMGFYNFCYSLAVCFFTVGYWIRHHERWTRRTTISLGLLSLLLYFCHGASLIMAYIAITVLILWFCAPKLRDCFEEQSRWVVWVKAISAETLPPLVAVLPAGVLLLWYLA